MAPSPPRDVAPPPRKLTGENMNLVELSHDPAKLATADRNKMTALLSLPPELRNSIYEYVLGSYEWIWKRDLVTAHSRTALTGQELKHFFAITRVSRQTYTESALTFFHINTFVIDSTVMFEKWMAQTWLPAQRNAITTLSCSLHGVYDGPGSTATCRSFEEFESLKTLILTSSEADIATISDAEKARYQDMLRSASGKSSLEVVLSSAPEIGRKSWFFSRPDRG